MERNWVGDALTNAHVNVTLGLAEELYTGMGKQSKNWRLQAHLFRAFYDGYVQRKFQHEMQVEGEVMQLIESAARSAEGSVTAALRLLAKPWVDPAAKVLKLRTFELGYAINKTLGGGGHWGGMSVLQSQDPTLGLLTIDTSLNDKAYLTSALKNASALPPTARKAALAAILNWTDPGTGGFYDQLGVVPRSARISPGFGPDADPQFLYLLRGT